MKPQGAFPDLRLNSAVRTAEEPFWPSLTDIMTVIVMIFLMALVVMLLRNVDLVDRLRSTIAAERAAAQIARTTAEQKQAIALRLDAAESELADLRLRILGVTEERDRLRTRLADATAAANAVRAERDELLAQVSNLQQENAGISERLRTANQDYAALRTQHARLGEELAASKQAAATSENSLAKLRTDYSELQAKYDKLVRPARTSIGKYVVEVRYTKINRQFRIEARQDGEGPFQALDRAALDRLLARAKAAHPDTLYVRVIIPEDSGLSYNEAWSFTNDLLSRYDYYYQP
jgi:chromosome segregation ATPase